MAVETLDTFTDTNGTQLLNHIGETGAAWVQFAGTDISQFLTIQNNRLSSTSNVGWFRLEHELPSVNQRVAFTIHTASAGTMGVYCRCQDNGPAYGFGVASGGGISLHVINSGGNLVTLVSDTIVYPGGTPEIAISASGTNPVVLTGYVNGDPVLTHNDSTHLLTGTKAGLRMNSGSVIDDLTGESLVNIPAIMHHQRMMRQNA